MRTAKYGTEGLRQAFRAEGVLTLDAVKAVLGTTSKMTAFRKLRAVGYRASYSHSGRYYTLDEVARYDRHGLWTFNEIHFSRHGSLLETLPYLIRESPEGYFARELEELVRVRVHNTLLKLHEKGDVWRQQIGSHYLYLANEWGDRQLEQRKDSIQKAAMETDLPTTVVAGEELQDALRTFLWTLDERQRRLYLGFESMKLGQGGDGRMARLAGVNVKTVARGRRELLSKDITPDRVREAGGGRPSVKKNGRAEGPGEVDG